MDNGGVWSEGRGSLALVASHGRQAPGIPAGGVFQAIDNPVINDAGQTAFLAYLTGGGITFTSGNNTGIWSEGSGSLSLVARTGNAAPGLPTKHFFSAINKPVFNAAGKTAFVGGVTGPTITGSNDSGIWSEGSGSLSLVARENNAAPGIAGGVYSTDGFSNPVLNNAGHTALSTYVSGSNVSNQGIWRKRGSTLELVARGQTIVDASGDPISSTFSLPAINGAGQTAFSTIHNGNSGIWSEGRGSLALIASAGNAAPGIPADGVFASCSQPVINRAGRVAFRGSIAGTSILSSDDTGIWSDGSGTLALVARESSAAPGIPSGGVFDGFADPIINGAGQTAFYATLTGPGITPMNNQGLWAMSPEGLRLFVRTGDILDVDPGIGTDFRTVSFIGFYNGSGGEDGRGVTWNDSGTLAFTLNFSDGTSGVFTATLKPLETFSSWISIPAFSLAPAVRDISADPDGDGIPNGVENFFGTNPGIPSGGLVAGAFSGNAFVFIHPQNPNPASDLTASYRWSKDLVNFLEGGAADAAGTIVTFTSEENTPTPGFTRVTATITGTSSSKLFLQVGVTQDQ